MRKFPVQQGKYREKPNSMVFSGHLTGTKPHNIADSDANSLRIGTGNWIAAKATIDIRAGGKRSISLDGGLVGGLAGGEHDPERQAVLVHQGVDLGAQSSTRTADGVIRAPFLPPAACWCARMMELSIRCRDCGDVAASASNTFSQIPAFAHLL